MKKIELNLDTYFAKLGDLVKDNIKEFNTVTELAAIPSGATLILARTVNKEKKVEILIFDSVKGDKTMVMKESVMAKETIEYTPKKLDNIFYIEPDKLYPGNFENTDLKKDLKAYIKQINYTVNPTTPIARVFFANKEQAESKEGKEYIKNVETYMMDNYGVECQSRWSNGAGKVVGGDFATLGGINVSAKNRIPTEYTELHRKDAYHHKKHAMYIFQYEEGKEKVVALSVSEGHKEMLVAYKETVQSLTKEEAVA